MIFRFGEASAEARIPIGETLKLLSLLVGPPKLETIDLLRRLTRLDDQGMIRLAYWCESFMGLDGLLSTDAGVREQDGSLSANGTSSAVGSSAGHSPRLDQVRRGHGPTRP